MTPLPSASLVTQTTSLCVSGRALVTHYLQCSKACCCTLHCMSKLLPVQSQSPELPPQHTRPGPRCSPSTPSSVKHQVPAGHSHRCHRDGQVAGPSCYFMEPRATAAPARGGCGIGHLLELSPTASARSCSPPMLLVPHSCSQPQHSSL